MYQVSNEAQEEILKSNRQFGAKIVIDECEITEGILSIKRYQQSNTGDYISIGSAVSSYVDIKTWNAENVIFEDKEFELSVGILVNDTPEYIPIGRFTAQKPLNDDGIISFTAYDRLYSNMSDSYSSQLTYPTDGKNVISEISEMTGVPIDISNLPDGIMINQKLVSVEMSFDESGNAITANKYENPYDGYSYRDALGFVAQFYCKFVTVDRSGTVIFPWYTDDNGNMSDPVRSITADHYYDDLSVNESMFSVKAITCVTGDKTLGSGTGISSIQMENPAMTQEYLDSIYEKVKNLTFYPLTLSFHGDPRIDLGDTVSITDKYDKEYIVPVMYITQDYDGGIITEIASHGRTGQEANSSKSPTQKRLEALESSVAVVQELIGKKADFETIAAQMITINKILFDGMTLVEFCEQIISQNASIEKTVDGLLIDVSSLSTKKEISDNNSIQTYDVTAIPTLENYPTVTDFFIWDVCSDTLYCSDELVCGTNNYEAHLNEIAHFISRDTYYIFEKNTDETYGWRQLSQAEVDVLADKSASVSVKEGSVVISAKYEDEQCDMVIGSDGVRATVIYCC